MRSNILFIAVGDGGSDESLLLLLKNLDQNLFCPIVLVNRNGRKRLIPELININIRYVEMPFGMDMYPKVSNGLSKYIKFIIKLFLNQFLNFITFFRLLLFCVFNKIKIIHTNSSCIQIGVKVAKILKIFHVWHFREFQDLDFNLKPLWTKTGFDKLKFHSINLNIAVSKEIFLYHKLRPNDEVIYNGIEREVYFTSIKKEKYFLFVGRITENKGAREIINCFIEFLKINPGYKLKLAGVINHDYFNLLKSEINIKDNLDHIDFLGYVSDANKLMGNATAFIMGSSFEAFGRVTAEAMANKCLVIGKDNGGTKEQFDLGKSTFGKEIALRYNNEDELLKCMLIAVKENNQSSEMIERAYACVGNFYQLDNYVKNVSNVYIKLLS